MSDPEAKATSMGRIRRRVASRRTSVTLPTRAMMLMRAPNTKIAGSGDMTCPFLILYSPPDVSG
jgi:hypothetical protein